MVTTAACGDGFCDLQAHEAVLRTLGSAIIPIDAQETDMPDTCATASTSAGPFPHSLQSSAVVHGERVVMELRGELDRSAAALADLLQAAIDLDRADLVVDMSEVRFMNSATAGVFLRAAELLAQQSRTIALRSPSACARRLLTACGAGDLIEPTTVDSRRTTTALTADLRSQVAAPASVRINRLVGRAADQAPVAQPA